jgi:hypothetical protein
VYIGKPPTVGNFQVCDAISVVNGQAAYTLQVGGTNVAPESANHMLVSLNGILQKPVSSYTISGSTMTFASNLATGDSIDFVQILGNVLDIGQPSDDTVTAAKLNNDIISGTTALAAIPATDDEFLISDAGTLKRIDAQFFQNTPAFAAYAPSDQDSLSSGTWTKLTIDSEFFDSDGKYNTTNYRFTPTVAGKYMFGAQIYADATDTNQESSLAFYKNGTRFLYKEESADNINTQQLTGVITLDSDDYVELYLKISVASSGTFAMDMDGTTSNNRAYWYGYKLIGA